MSDMCKDCKQGYTKQGYAAYPDHIELCSKHMALESLAQELVGALDKSQQMMEFTAKEIKYKTFDFTDKMRLFSTLAKTVGDINVVSSKAKSVLGEK